MNKDDLWDIAGFLSGCLLLYLLMSDLWYRHLFAFICLFVISSSLFIIADNRNKRKKN